MATVLKGRFVLSRLVVNTARKCSSPALCSFSSDAKTDVEKVKDKELKVVYEEEDVSTILIFGGKKI